MKRAALALLVIGLCASAAAQVTQGSRELGLWIAGGHSVPGGTTGTSVMNAGVRYGWVLTGEHLPGILRGNFEYAVDAVPMYLVIKNGTTYGGGFDPLVLKWNFAGSKKVVPFVELAGGTLFSTREVPAGTSAVNFRSGAAFGIHILGARWAPTLALRYEHISNAGLASPNPGINTVQVQLAITSFHKR
jgi:lipid A 3-O-deacylase